ncbi:multidrug effflux MFS transporter [Rouxiella badensis]|uniref:multidrug effflux MFS transporter n=1 Tax=Rouxiella badensis TaxID=1646377 RepID=UPI0028D58826|nr:multidrug effflux MFS transporter [Rouxiella badensis]
MKEVIRNRFLLMCAVVMMLVLSLFSSDIFLPALPDIVRQFGVTPSQGQQMLGHFLLGVALMQLVYGPLSDSLGRKKLLIFGTSLFSLATFAIIYAPNFKDLLALRLAQAVGASASIVLGRAIIGDLFSKEEAGKIFLTLFPIVGMSPALAPMIGGQISNLFGWHACFIFAGLFGVVLLFLTLTAVPETLPREKRNPLSAVDVMQGYIALLLSRRFWHYALIPCIAYAVFYAYIAESPFLLLKQGVSNKVIGFTYLSLSLTYVTGNLIARWTMSKGLTLDKALATGYLVFVAGGIVMFLTTHFAPNFYIGSITAISIMTLGNGFLLPLGTSGAVTAVPHNAGSASGLMGAMQIGAAAIIAGIIGPLSGHNPQTFGMIVFVLAIAGFFIFQTTRRLSYRADLNRQLS